MNSPEFTDATRNDEQASGLWRGDAGGLKLDARRALVQLLKGPVLDGMRMPVIWKALLESEDLIRSRLNDLFLDLVIDHEQLFAFTRQADTDPVKAPILLKRKPLNYIETYLFLFLRLRLSSAESRASAPSSASTKSANISPTSRAAATTPSVSRGTWRAPLPRRTISACCAVSRAVKTPSRSRPSSR